jgi:hypothetical protein
MLIRIAEFMEIPEIPPEINIPRTVARLKRIDNGNYCVGHPLELVPLVSFVFTNVNKDREFIPKCGDISLRQNQLPNKMVEGTSEIVQYFPDAQTEVITHGRHIKEAVDLISRCVVDLFVDRIEIEVTEGQQITAQSIELLFSPIKFGVGTFNRSHNIKLPSQVDSTPMRLV